MTRKIIYRILFISCVIVFGLSIKKFSIFFSPYVVDATGDFLWALMFFELFTLLMPSQKTLVVALFTLAFSFTIEFSQLYHVPFIDSIRDTFFGGMLLGFHFVWTDLIWYSAGILAGALIEYKMMSPVNR